MGFIYINKYYIIYRVEIVNYTQPQWLTLISWKLSSPEFFL